MRLFWIRDAANVRLDQCRYNADLRQMVTPVHRFHSLNSAGNVAGPSNMNNCRVIRTTIRANNETQNNLPVGSTQHTQLNNNTNNVTTAGNNQLILSNSTSNGTNRSLLDFSEFSQPELSSYRLRCAVCITFVLATGYVAVAKFFFGDQSQGIEAFVFWALLTLLLCACFYSTLRRRNQRNNHQDHHIQEEHIATVTTTNTISNENIRPISVVRQNPPPPYHIAILIPPPNTPDEAPPPSYDKVMR
ncbi:uncharacterized protein LOC143178152 isoform X2 [Calliopsis andreniformis]|uniref:uncharacterized protein LOC143178152 isoform X2 n=1 Tax=Calliopsis andreniformis TaxID=337506 RepID=UPI003FCEB72C